MRPLALLMFLGSGGPLLAQRAGVGASIVGEVTDSVHRRPLAGALVMATRLSPEPALYLSAVTDKAGRFRFDSLAAGRYAVGFSDAMLDSLEVVLPPRQVELGIDEHLTLTLTTPSASTLQAAACPGLTLPAGEGAVVGAVTDADSERPLVGATVVVSWRDLSVDTKTMRAITKDHVGSVRTDSSGQFRACMVPTGTRLLLQVQHAQRAGAVVVLVVDDTIGVARCDFSLSPRDAQPIADAATASDTVPPSPLSGTSTLTGTIRGDAGTPLRDAHITVEGARGSAVTDSLGRFSLGGLPAGTQSVEVRRIGYFLGRGQVELRSGRAVEWDPQLTKFISLDSVRIIARRSMYPEFSRNRKAAAGKFFDEEAIAQRNAFRTADLLRGVAGLRIVPSNTGFGDTVLSTRGSGWSSRCAMSVVIDGVQGEDLNDIMPSDIGAMEVYVSPNGAPPQYVHGDCGVIVIWTKR